MDSETGRTAPAHIDREQLKAELILSSVRMKKIVCAAELLKENFLF